VEVLVDARTRSTPLVANACAPRNARLFTREVLADWGLADLADDACTGVSELSAWMAANESAPVQRITLVWDGPLLFTEVGDAGKRLPLRPVWRAAPGGYAVALIEAVSEDWGADHTPLGRCVWASYATGRGEAR